LRAPVGQDGPGNGSLDSSGTAVVCAELPCWGISGASCRPS
jgi:hypothetical protein